MCARVRARSLPFSPDPLWIARGERRLAIKLCVCDANPKETPARHGQEAPETDIRPALLRAAVRCFSSCLSNPFAVALTGRPANGPAPSPPAQPPRCSSMESFGEIRALERICHPARPLPLAPRSYCAHGRHPQERLPLPIKTPPPLLDPLLSPSHHPNH